MQHQVGPCANTSELLMLAHIIGGILNTMLLSWLAHRRLMADRRANGKRLKKLDQGANRVTAQGPKKQNPGGYQDFPS